MSSIGSWGTDNQSGNYYQSATTPGVAYGAAITFTDMAIVPTTIYCTEVTLTNDGPDIIFYSWDSLYDHGKLYAGETRTVETAARSKVYLRHTAAPSTVRIWAS